MTRIELLAPARNAEIGIQAIRHGADAVYIGAPKFGARSAATNSVQDIEKLSREAHKFHAKVYITLNTILYDHEISEAVQSAWQVYQAGADALIIQDMGLLECELPPVALHASTQTHNASWQKVDFLEKVGFQRVVLARELSLLEITEIRNKTRLELECFIHGALCVSYSGQCYFSHSISGRSANRGECCQPCRMAYNLIDNQNQKIIKDKHLLSLGDLNHQNSIGELIDAGITSFKIEGRLKELEYVKNVTAFYRQIIDRELEKSAGFTKASAGKCTFHFNPNPAKTFQRKPTEYFLHQRNTAMASPETPKSIGESIGKIRQSGPGYFILDSEIKINNGDGICWPDAKGLFEGSRVNKTEGIKNILASNLLIPIGTEIYRNYNHKFLIQLQGNSANRTIDIELELSITDSGFLLTAQDEEGYLALEESPFIKEIAQKPEKSHLMIQNQLTKAGDSVFNVIKINDLTYGNYFLPASFLNQLRRSVLEKLEEQRIQNSRKEISQTKPNNYPYPEKILTYKANIGNKKAMEFYQRHGVEKMEQAFELQNEFIGKEIMTTRYCIKYQQGNCPKESKNSGNQLKEPLFLENQGKKYRLEFDCKNCLMRVYFVG